MSSVVFSFIDRDIRARISGLSWTRNQASRQALGIFGESLSALFQSHPQWTVTLPDFGHFFSAAEGRTEGRNFFSWTADGGMSTVPLSFTGRASKLSALVPPTPTIELQPSLDFLWGGPFSSWTASFASQSTSSWWSGYTPLSRNLYQSHLQCTPQQSHWTILTASSRLQNTQKLSPRMQRE
jgi:hypothetical protein